MKVRAIVFVLIVSVLFLACDKNTVSKIPHIALTGLFPQNDTVRTSLDSVFIEFNLVDGDGDIGYSDPNDPGVSQIYLKDSRYDTGGGYAKISFPPIDVTIEDPKKGLQGSCILIQTPVPQDSIHAVTSDTVTYELYIKDRAGNASNHIVTHAIIIVP